MRPKQILYVLTGGKSHRAACQLGVSLFALRRVEPDSVVTLSCDRSASELLERDFAGVLDNIDLVLQPETFHTSSIESSRELKILSLQYLSGDFVYLDNDTLPVMPFYEELATSVDQIGLAKDHNHEFPLQTGVPQQVWDRYEALGWDTKPRKYFNAGLGFYRDGTLRQQLSSRWFDLWNESVRRMKIYNDQHCLNAAIVELDLGVTELPSCFNAMATVHPRHAIGARVYHYFAGNRLSLDGTLFEYLISYFDEHRAVDWETLDRAISIEHPWMPPYWPKRFMKAGRPYLALKHWLINRLPARSII
ncbi:MAG: hypothetical protein AAGG48_14110 [Planctomycetota bacterium]